MKNADLLSQMSAARREMVEAKIALLTAKIVRERALAAGNLKHAGSPDLGGTELLRKATLIGRVESEPLVVTAIDETLKAEADFLRKECAFLNLEAEYKLTVASLQVEK